MTVRRPRIAILMDENTSGGATRYEAAKGTFRAVRDAGGLPFGIPYLPEIVDPVLGGFDGLLTLGGRFAYPDEWYLPGEVSKAPPSERFGVERALVEAFLDHDKPILGICAGMQMLACLNGCRLTPDLRSTMPDALEHDRPGHIHSVRLVAGSRLATLVGHPSIEVNTFHREAVAHLSDSVLASAHACDGVIEAIEVPSRRFAVGIQWHQELLVGVGHAGDGIFTGFVEAAT